MKNPIVNAGQIGQMNMGETVNVSENKTDFHSSEAQVKSEVEELVKVVEALMVDQKQSNIDVKLAMESILNQLSEVTQRDDGKLQPKHIDTIIEQMDKYMGGVASLVGKLLKLKALLM